MDVIFEEYLGWITKYIRNHDTREINFQNDVVKRLLERLYPDYDVVCVDTKGSDAKAHDYYAYSGSYEDEQGRRKPTTPDLLICRGWNWFNRDNDNITYLATVEVKSPHGAGAIYKKDFEGYLPSWREKIRRHLAAEKVDKVIFTDTFKWEFYDKNLDSHEEIVLVDRVRKGSGFGYKWKENAKEEFERLKEKLQSFLEG